MMNLKDPSTLLSLLSALEGLGEGKKHLKQSAHELLLAAKIMNKTTVGILQESGLPQSLPWVTDFMKVGGSLLDELLEKTKAPVLEGVAAVEIPEAVEEPKKVQRGRTKLKVVKAKA
ncbi:MAG: hypothetical protein HQM15_09975 [Deltaproteobacteria bacterium]|nr:hypothetical protein [Deltaproteobacteria bacterium]